MCGRSKVNFIDSAERPVNVHTALTQKTFTQCLGSRSENVMRRVCVGVLRISTLSLTLPPHHPPLHIPPAPHPAPGGYRLPRAGRNGHGSMKSGRRVGSIPLTLGGDEARVNEAVFSGHARDTDTAIKEKKAFRLSKQ